jgi:uncharacterized membrane protein
MYHFDCIKNHLFQSKSCPHCGKHTSMMHYLRGHPHPATAAPGPKQQQAQPARRAQARSIPAQRTQPPAAQGQEQAELESTPARRKKPRGGIALLIMNLLIVGLLLASAYYASSNYVGYAPDLTAATTSATVLPGETIRIPFDIENSGNLVAHYSLEVEASGTSLPVGWDPMLYQGDEEIGLSAQVKLEPLSPKSFSLALTTGSNDSANTQGNVKVSITSNDGKYKDSMVFNVATEAIHQYSIEQEDHTKYGSAGETTSYTFMITNEGNSSDTYNIDISSVTSGWSAALLKGDSVTIEPGRSASIITTITAPSTAQGNDQCIIELTVDSTKNPENTESLQFSMVVNPTYGFELLSNEQSRVVLGGTMTTFTFKLRNVGNSADTYSIIEQGAFPSGWSSTVSKREVTIEAGETTTIGVTIIVPEDALPSLKGISTVSVISAGNDETNTARFEVTTAAQQTKVVLLELFTSVNCGYCPYAEQAMDQLLLAYPGKVVSLEYHLNDEFVTSYTEARAAYYGIVGTPQAMFDGFRKEPGGSALTYDRYVTKLQDLMTQDLKLRIDVAITASETPGLDTVTVALKDLGLPSGADLEVFFVTYRNGLSPSNNRVKVYNYVVIDGTSRHLGGLNNMTTLNMELEIPSDGGLVVFVQDRDSHVIYQSIMI